MALIVSVNEAAKIFGYQSKTLRKLIQSEGAPIVSRGTQGKATFVDTVALSHWLMDRASGSTPMEKARLGKIREEITQLQLDRADRQAQLCHVADVKELYSETLRILKEGLRALPERLSQGDSALCARWEHEINTAIKSATKGLIIEDE
tara:strand:- start:116 stop:562 length:447 start_codon:yes stop_codon:yes gene_type:complete